MASVEQWKEWKEEYLLAFMEAVESCAPKFALASLSEEGIDLNVDKAIDLIAEAYERDILVDDDPSFIFILASIYWLSGKNQRRFRHYSIEDAIRDYNQSMDKHEAFIYALNDFDGYYGCAFWFVYIPLVDFVGFFLKNHPLVYRDYLLKWTNGDIDLSYCGLTQTQLFDFLCSMTQYGLYKLLVDNKFPHPDDLLGFVQKNDFTSFFKICNDNNVDLTNLSEIVGYILNSQSLHIIDDDPDTLESKKRNLFDMVGTNEANVNEILSKLYNHDFVCDVLPFDMTKEDTLNITALAYRAAIIIPYFEMLEDDEYIIMDRIINNPYFEGFMKIVEFIRLKLKAPIIKQIKPHLTQDEIERFIPNLEAESSQEENYEQNLAQHSKSSDNNCKTLASRWMTELYQRMTDDVLVEIVSKKIWPQLQDEVDSLKWAPSKRVLPTFQKTKNMMAACILFHALELAKIARLPKQEKEAVSEGFYMSAEERAQYGIYETSKRNAGIAHTKKRYNDTLPVGYMETLERFIKEEELPGRTTSRTYLKLVNKWVKTDPDEISDNIYTQAKQLLNESEMEKDLGPQLYLLKDNRVRLKSMLKEWRDLTPELFNIPI